MDIRKGSLRHACAPGALFSILCTWISQATTEQSGCNLRDNACAGISYNFDVQFERHRLAHLDTAFHLVAAGGHAGANHRDRCSMPAYFVVAGLLRHESVS